MNRGNATPEQIKQARLAANLSQEQAARVIWTGPRTWQRYESGDRGMPLGLWELFLLKTYQPDRFDA